MIVTWLVLVYLATLWASWLLTKKFYEICKPKATPGIFDVIYAVCPFLNIFVVFYYSYTLSDYLEDRWDTSKFFRLKRVEK